MKVGFTGTREGMAPEQRAAVRALLAQLRPTEAHHGDCLGADEQFHLLVYYNDGPRVVGHPPLNNQMRAYCGFDFCHVPKDYLDRNRNIVNETDVLIACPKGFEEEQRSGTWATVRWARATGKPVYVVWPDGMVRHEGQGVAPASVLPGG